jgi:transcriptional regulator with XRE-family HTH domain
VTFGSMHGRLLEMVRERVRNGQMTERRLGRLTGVSQPHIHNVLKGVRFLSTELADQILEQLEIAPTELLGLAEPKDLLPFVPVPLLADTFGTEMGELRTQNTAGSTQVPSHLLATVRRPLTIRLGHDPLAAPRFESGDVVLIDQSRERRTRIEKNAVYVALTASGPRLRYVRVSGARVYLPSEQCLMSPWRWENAPLGAGGITAIVLGRAEWISRHLAMPV